MRYNFQNITIFINIVEFLLICFAVIYNIISVYEVKLTNLISSFEDIYYE